MPVNRGDAEILKLQRDDVKNDIRKVDIATVLAVNPARQTVDVQVCTNNPIHDAVGNAFLEDAPNLSDVPLACLRGGGFLVWMPVAVGDTVLILYSDLSTDTWRAGDGSVADPGFQGKHTRDSPFAIPAWAPDAKALAAPVADPTKVIIGKDGASAQIRISATDIELGAPATDSVGLASKIDANFAALATAAAAAIAGAVAGDGGHAAFTAFAAALPTTPTGSLLVKAQ
jgi:hypothetical protein